MSTIVRLLNSPLASVGALVFDCELGLARGQRREYTRRRVAAGVSLVDHSRLEPREWTLEAAVSAVTQLQNVARPGADPLAILQATAVGAALAVPVAGTAAGLALGFSGAFASRLDDFEDSLVAAMQEGDEVDVVTKAPGAAARRFRAVVTEWSAATTARGPDAGDSATYRLSLLEVLRAGALGLAAATLEALGLNGTATTSNLGPTPSPVSQADLLP